MTRVRADDYDDKRQAILDAAAVLFAQTGYANVKMTDIAKACGTSKSMLYYYFPKKEDVLFEIMKEHVQSYLDMTEAVAARRSPPAQRLREFVAMWMKKSNEARARFALLMYEFKYLPARERKIITDMERRLIEALANLVGQANPQARLAPGSRPKILSLLLFGMLNWTEVWFRSNGAVGAGEMAEVISNLFLHGLIPPGAAPEVPERGSGSF